MEVLKTGIFIFHNAYFGSEKSGNLIIEAVSELFFGGNDINGR